MQRKHVITLLSVVLTVGFVGLVLVACGGNQQEQAALPTATPAPTQAEPTATPTQVQPTVTPFPTATPVPVEPPAEEEDAQEETEEDGQEQPEEDAEEDPEDEAQSEENEDEADQADTIPEAPQEPAPLPQDIDGFEKGDRVYATDFSSGWPRIDDDQGRIRERAGAYDFKLEQSAVRWVNTTVVEELDMIVEVQVTPEECPAGGGYGVFFRMEDGDNYYALTFFCDGRVRVFARDEGELAGPLLDTTLPGDLSAAEKSAHLVRVGMVGTQFVISFDGQIVGQFESDLHGEGDVALYAVTSGELLQVAFDNLEVWKAQ